MSEIIFCKFSYVYPVLRTFHIYISGVSLDFKSPSVSFNVVLKEVFMTIRVDSYWNGIGYISIMPVN